MKVLLWVITPKNEGFTWVPMVLGISGSVTLESPPFQRRKKHHRVVVVFTLCCALNSGAESRVFLDRGEFTGGETIVFWESIGNWLIMCCKNPKFHQVEYVMFCQMLIWRPE